MKNQERVPRKFSGKVFDMLHAIASITDAAIDHAAELSEDDTSITAISLGNLRRRVNDLRENILAADNSAERRQEQAAVRKFTRSAAEELASIKTFIETHFPDDEERRAELLEKLGFNGLYRDAVNRGHKKGMGALLVKVAGQLEAETEASLILAGLPPKRVDAIRELAAGYHNHTVGGQGGHGRQLEYTQADVQAMNAMYTEVMSLAKIAKRRFKHDPATRSRFVMSKMAGASVAAKKLPDNGHQKPAA